jgi:hypothetical protein
VDVVDWTLVIKRNTGALYYIHYRTSDKGPFPEPADQQFFLRFFIHRVLRDSDGVSKSCTIGVTTS